MTTPLTGREKIMVAMTLMTVLAAAVVLLVATHRIRNLGRIKTIGLEVYVDEDLTQLCEVIDWGTFEPGQQKTVSVYVFNPKTTNFTVYCNTSAWNPAEIGQYMTFWFNLNKTFVQPSEVAELIFMLQVHSQIPEGFEEFSFDIYVIATEYLEP